MIGDLGDQFSLALYARKIASLCAWIIRTQYTLQLPLRIDGVDETDQQLNTGSMGLYTKEKLGELLDCFAFRIIFVRFL